MTTRWDVTKAIRASELPAPGRHLMLTLADVAEVGTAEIPPQRTPSVKVLVEETGLSRSTVKAHLAALEAAGWIARTRPTLAQQLRGERVRYALSVGAPSYDGEMTQGGSGDDPGVGQEMTQGGSGDDPLIGTDVSDGVDPPLPPVALERPVVAEVPGEGEKTIKSTPGQSDDEAALVAEILALRSEWTAVQIRSALDERSVRERPWPIVAAAMRLVAADHRSTSPGRLRTPGPWWADAAAGVRRADPPARPTPRALPALVAAERAAVTGTARAQRAAAARAILAAGGSREAS